MFYDNDGAPYWYTHECDLLTRDPLTLTPAEQRAFRAIAEIWNDYIDDGSICIVCKQTEWPHRPGGYEHRTISTSMQIGICVQCYYEPIANPSKHEIKHEIYKLDFSARYTNGRKTPAKCVIHSGYTISRTKYGVILFIIFTAQAVGFIDDIVQYIAGIALNQYLCTNVT